MKKKIQKSARSPADVPAVAAVDIKALIHDHALFFDKLVELIPAKFYLASDGDAKPWFQGLSKAAKASAKQQTRENIKKARRDRLDPEKSQTSTLDLLKQTIEKEKSTEDPNSGSDDEDDDEENLDTERKTILPDGSRSVTYEELRQKLRRKIELLRGNRGGSEKPQHKPKNERKEKENQQKKRKRIDETQGNTIKGTNLGENDEEIEKDVNEATKGIEFGKVKLAGGLEEVGKRKKKKRKLSKLQELERAKRLDEVKKVNPTVAERQSWKAATSRAMGVKVHDDPKLLKESIKKEKRKQSKNAEKWKERVESRDKLKEEKQQKRGENISERIHQKKMRKIAKREKKLMRPGFEGRKEGYITKD